ncbi:MAG: CinA family protein [bacterium]
MSKHIHTSTAAWFPEQMLVTFFSERKLTLALAESCTGGLIAARITSIPGSSTMFNGAVVCYANDVKRDLLGVLQATLETEGAVSASCAKAMAEGARKALKADVAVSVTGIAGPGGGTPAKPVGLVFIGVATETVVSAEKHFFTGDRENIRKQAVDAAMATALLAVKQ